MTLVADREFVGTLMDNNGEKVDSINLVTLANALNRTTELWKRLWNNSTEKTVYSLWDSYTQKNQNNNSITMFKVVRDEMINNEKHIIEHSLQLIPRVIKKELSLKVALCLMDTIIIGVAEEIVYEGIKKEFEILQIHNYIDELLSESNNLDR